MESFAHALSVQLTVPVQDLTGLKGKYDIDVSWVPDLSFEPARGLAAAQAASDPDSEDRLRRLPKLSFNDALGREDQRGAELRVVRSRSVKPE